MAHVAWCCYYVCVAARTVISVEYRLGQVSISKQQSVKVLATLQFSYRWLRGAQLAINDLQRCINEEGCDPEALAFAERQVSSLRQAMLSLPALGVGVLLCVLNTADDGLSNLCKFPSEGNLHDQKESSERVEKDPMLYVHLFL